MSSLPACWRSDNWLARCLTPVAWLFVAASRARRWWLSRHARRLPVPVVIVGSIFIGGSGKTPLVAWLARRALAEGYHPGVAMRGYGGRSKASVRLVDATTDAFEVGDEAVLTARDTGLPVAVGRDRVAVAEALVASHGCDLVIGDDGLQHYHLYRDAEVAVISGDWGLGNGRCLPAGPLREPPSRLSEVDLVAINGDGQAGVPGACYQLQAGQLQAVAAEVERSVSPSSGAPVHAVAGIGVPARFFTALERAGYDIIRHAFPDHYVFTASDLAFGDDLPVIMTGKDAVKCQHLDQGHLWFLPVDVVASDELRRRADQLLTNLQPNS